MRRPVREEVLVSSMALSAWWSEGVRIRGVVFVVVLEVEEQGKGCRREGSSHCSRTKQAFFRLPEDAFRRWMVVMMMMMDKGFG